MSRVPIIAVIGAGAGSDDDHRHAFLVGQGIAQRGWHLVCGGLSGVMAHASRGAREAGGTVIGILPGPDSCAANPDVTIPIATNMGHARNVIIAHTADQLIAIGGAEGTLSEIAIALKLGKGVVSLGSWTVSPRIRAVETPARALETVAGWLASVTPAR